jgi:ABC-type multidrug transport system ATPase subunit
MKIEIIGLKKEYPNDVQALKGIDLVIEQGMFGLLGPNGAGKTTLMQILVTLIEPTAGVVRFGNLDITKDRAQIRSMLGYLPQNFSTFTRLKAWEFLDYSGQLAGMTNKRMRRESVDKMLELVGIYDARNRQANKLSGGMKRRLGIAQAMIGNPKLLVIDEPTTGLDPEERLHFRNMMSKMSHNETIIILSTHIVGDISSTCNTMAILNKGELIYSGSPEALIQRTKGRVWAVQVKDAEMQQLKERYPVVVSVPTLNGYEVQVVADSVEGYDAKPAAPDIEHAYVNLMEQSTSEGWAGYEIA